MRLHILQHIPFEDESYIGLWAEENRLSITKTHLYKNDELPGVDDFDWLIIMGGLMSAYEEDKYPWLIREKKFIKDSIDTNKIIIGICLGAQIIASVLGARVYKNIYKEIGWFPITMTKEAVKTDIGRIFPEKLIAFHSHGDTFDIPHGAVRIAESEACKNQGFIYKNNVFAFQFHLEFTQESIEKILMNCKDEIHEEKYIQSIEHIRSNYHLVADVNNHMKSFLNLIKKNFG